MIPWCRRGNAHIVQQLLLHLPDIKLDSRSTNDETCFDVAKDERVGWPLRRITILYGGGGELDVWFVKIAKDKTGLSIFFLWFCWSFQMFFEDIFLVALPKPIWRRFLI